MKKKLEMPTYQVGEKILYSAKSNLIDRYSPAIEKIILPAYKLPEGRVEIEYEEKITKSESMMVSGLKKSLIRLQKRYEPQKISGRILIDYRRNFPGNWSHVTNLLLPFAFFILDELQEYFDKNKPLFILEKNIPIHTCKLFNHFNLEYIKTDDDVEGNFVHFKYEPFHSLRCLAQRWVQDIIAKQSSYASLLNDSQGIVDKVFISRKDTRKITNETEVELFLNEQGFKKIYAEDLSVQDQIKLYMHATDIVAVHGAALGPIIYRPSDKPPLKIIEIFSPGLMSNCYRGCADQIGAKWVGVRGRFSSDLFPEAYDFSQPFLQYSYKDLFIDIDSLSAALNDLKPF